MTSGIIWTFEMRKRSNKGTEDFLVLKGWQNKIETFKRDRCGELKLEYSCKVIKLPLIMGFKKVVISHWIYTHLYFWPLFSSPRDLEMRDCLSDSASSRFEKTTPILQPVTAFVIPIRRASYSKFGGKPCFKYAFRSLI